MTDRMNALNSFQLHVKKPTSFTPDVEYSTFYDIIFLYYFRYFCTKFLATC